MCTTLLVTVMNIAFIQEQTAGAPEPQKQEIVQVVPEPTGLAEELTDKLVDPQEEGEDDGK